MKIRSLLLVPALLFAACTAKDQPKVEAPKGDAPKAAITAEITAKLEKADAADGKVDKVVSKCAGCALGMDGKAEHSAKLGDYTLHFCDHCASADPLKAVEALKN